MTNDKDGGPAFPHPVMDMQSGEGYGMTLRDYFATAALSNPALCTGIAEEWQLRGWFGNAWRASRFAGGITRAQIASKQAHDYADAMLKERAK